MSVVGLLFFLLSLNVLNVLSRFQVGITRLLPHVGNRKTVQAPNDCCEPRAVPAVTPISGRNGAVYWTGWSRRCVSRCETPLPPLLWPLHFVHVPALVERVTALPPLPPLWSVCPRIGPPLLPLRYSGGFHRGL